MRASVVIPAFNAAPTITRTLEAIAGQDFTEPYEVIVVDDGSSDDTVALAAAAAPSARILRQEREGPACARNLGARSARGEVLAFTDADCFPTRHWLREGVKALDDAPLVQGAVRPDPSAARKPFDRTVWVSGESGLYECASLFVGRELFERLGGFEDWLGARVGKELAEDAWFGWRARRSGARTGFSERALVHHAVFPRRAVAYAAERLRLVYFPAIVRRMPELRTHLLFGRWFLNRRSAALDLALAAVVGASLLGSVVPLVAGAPYLALLLRGAAPWRRQAPRVLAADLAADLVGFGALLAGSVRSRNLVL